MGYKKTYEVHNTEVYGHATLDAPHSLAKIVGEDLIIGGKTVIGYKASEFDNEIPCFYTIRYFDGKWANLITTFDLTSDGKCWTPDIKFDTAEECFEYIMSNKDKNDTNYPTFDVYLEEEMRIK